MQYYSDNTLNFRIRVNTTHDPKGPDGKGWNRLSIIPLEPFDRCILKPKSRPAALDSLRGMARYGVITAYDHCSSATACSDCVIYSKPKLTWRKDFHVREDLTGRVWLLNEFSNPFLGWGVGFTGWADLISTYEVPALRRHIDKFGIYWLDN